MSCNWSFWEGLSSPVNDNFSLRKLTIIPNEVRSFSNFFCTRSLLAGEYTQGMVRDKAGKINDVGYSDEWLKYTDYKRGPVKYDKP